MTPERAVEVVDPILAGLSEAIGEHVASYAAALKAGAPTVRPILVDIAKPFRARLSEALTETSRQYRRPLLLAFDREVGRHGRQFAAMLAASERQFAAFNTSTAADIAEALNG